jgi:ATP-dependent Lon protease
VSRAGEVLQHALVRMPEPIEWVEPAGTPAAVDTADDAAKSLAH